MIWKASHGHFKTLITQPCSVVATCLKASLYFVSPMTKKMVLGSFYAAQKGMGDLMGLA